MTKPYYIFAFICICVVQMLINNFFNVSQYLLLSLLPMLILSLPLKYPTSVNLLFAFCVGVIVDLVSSPVIGLSCCPLLLCAFAKNYIIRLVYGVEILWQREDSPLNYQSTKEVIISLIIICALYFLVYVWIDTAGTRPFSFVFQRWIYSTLLSAFVCGIFSSFIFKSE